MAVKDSTNLCEAADWISQTPPNLVENNYYLKELQEKVDSDWRFRPNRVIVERETGIGTNVYEPIEVVLQTVKNDKGEEISADWKRIVFRNIKENTRLGDRFRFAPSFNLECSEIDKNVWLCLNHEPYTPTASEVICRCDGSLGSIYVNEDGATELHYEPVVQPMKLGASGVKYNEVAVDTQGTLIYVSQRNKYTEQYFINQRFIIGAVTHRREFVNGVMIDKPVAKVYKISNILDYESSATYNVEAVPLIKIYFEVDQMGANDDLDNRIAFNGLVPEPTPEKKVGVKTIKLVTPEVMPQDIKEDIVFTPKIYEGGVETADTIVADTLTLGGSIYAERASVNDFAELTDNGNGTWTLHKKKSELTFTVSGKFHGTGELSNLEIPFELKLR